MEIQEINRKVHLKLDELRRVLHGFKPEITQILLAGSLRTGLYVGPKNAEVSGNRSCPFPKVIEADLRIVFSESANILDKDLLDRLESILKPEFKDVGEIYHWHQKVPVVNYFSYERISSDLGFEWEIALQQEPYLDLAKIWRQSQSQQEFEWHKSLRKALSASDISHDDLYDLKDRQRQEARWRYIASHALNQLNLPLENIKKNLPFQGEVKGPAQELIKYWHQGKTGMRCLNRPGNIVNTTCKDFPKLEKIGFQPEPPQWVEQATLIQQNLAHSYIPFFF